MSQITLQGPFVGASPTAAAPAGVPGVIADPPPAVSQLAHGHLLQGEVVGRNDKGQTLVRTELGTLAVNTKAQLPTGSQVTLQIRTHGAQLQIAVLQVDGHSPHLRGDVSGTKPPAPSAPASTAGSAPPLPSTQSAALPGTIDHPPASLAGLPKGTVLQGSVLGRDHAGHFLVRTEFGTLPLTTDVQLASGNRVTLRITTVVPQVQVLVSTPDSASGQARPATAPIANTAPGSAAIVANQMGSQAGSTPHSAQTAGGAPAAAAGGGTAAHIADTVDVLAVGQNLRAVVAATAGPQATSSPVTLTAGHAFQVRVTQVLPPTASTTPNPIAAAGNGITSTVQGGTVQGGTVQGGTVQGDTVRFGSIQAGPAPSESASSLSAPVGTSSGGSANTTLAASGLVRLDGVVTGQTASGQPLVRTAAGTLTLQIKAELPAGTRLQLDLPLQQLSAATTDKLPSASQPSSLLHSWPALQLALDSLQQLDGAAILQQQSAQGAAPPLPQYGARLTSGMLFFINALTGGSPETWLGQVAGGQIARRLDRAGQGELLSRLSGDLGAMSRLSDAAGEGWRLLPIPLYDGSQVHQLRLFLRGGKGGGKQSDGDSDATRFVLEVTMTRLGDLQLDGLVRERRFDLILRSRQSLSTAMRQNISAIFQSANEATGYVGSITFHDTPDWTPMPISAAATGMVV